MPILYGDMNSDYHNFPSFSERCSSISYAYIASLEVDPECVRKFTFEKSNAPELPFKNRDLEGMLISRFGLSLRGFFC